MHRYFQWKKKWLTAIGPIYMAFSFLLKLKRHKLSNNLTVAQTNEFSLKNILIEPDLDLNVNISESISTTTSIDLLIKQLDLNIKANLIRAGFIWINLFFKKIDFKKDIDAELLRVIDADILDGINFSKLKISDNLPSEVLSTIDTEIKSEMRIFKIDQYLNILDNVSSYETLLSTLYLKSYLFNTEINNIETLQSLNIPKPEIIKFVNHYILTLAVDVTESILKNIYPETLYFNYRYRIKGKTTNIQTLDTYIQNILYTKNDKFKITPTYYNTLPVSINDLKINPKNIIVWINKEYCFTNNYSLKEEIKQYSYPMTANITYASLLMFKDLEGWLVKDLLGLYFCNLKYN